MNDNPMFDLARRDDFEIGDVQVKPSIRMLASDRGEAKLEPRVMQVLLAFHDADGQVLTREDLMQQCWQGTFVGEDAVNRAIGELRRAIREAGAGFTIETIPRVGYRLTLAPSIDQVDRDEIAPPSSRVPRRTVLLGTGAAAIAAAGGAAWWLTAESRTERADRLLQEGREAYLVARPDMVTNVLGIFTKVTQLAPRRAEGWGWLAIAQLEFWETPGGPDNSSTLEAAKAAAEQALALDRYDPNARTAMAILRFRAGDWVAFERQLVQILTRNPDAIAASTYLASFLQATGRCAESWDVNEAGIRHEPFAPVLQFRRGLKHWIFGRIAEADRVLEKAANLWPEYPLVWNAILTVLAFSGRPAQALSILDSVGAKLKLDDTALTLWRSGLLALSEGSARDLAIVREMSTDFQPGRAGIVANAIMLLSELGEVDAAYASTEALLFGRGDFSGLLNDRKAGSGVYAHAGWRETQWLFTPATKAMRADPRFGALCERLGYTDFWRRRGIWPDPFVRGSLTVS